MVVCWTQQFKTSQKKSAFVKVSANNIRQARAYAKNLLAHDARRNGIYRYATICAEELTSEKNAVIQSLPREIEEMQEALRICRKNWDVERSIEIESVKNILWQIQFAAAFENIVT